MCDYSMQTQKAIKSLIKTQIPAVQFKIWQI